jgi:molybdate transport system ATP-binding protein
VTVTADFAIGLGDLRLDLAFSAAPGEILAILGPNGAGKTTALRALAGLHPIDTGTITIDGDVVDDPARRTLVPTEQRPVGVVFQDHLLFPHLSILENVAFGPRAAGVPAAEARRRAQEWLDRVGVGDLSGRKSRHVSGGQAQRTALARALVTEPRLLLLDEPLASLDVATRADIRRDLRRHLTAFDGATVLVTHDALDALALADRVVILEHGAITQEGSLAEVTTRPRSSYVADLIGVNLLRGDARGTIVRLSDHGRGTLLIADPTEGPVLALIRPHAVAIHRQRPEGSARNHWRGEISGFDLLGERVRVRLSGDVPLIAEVTPAAVAELALTEGDTVWASVKATEIETYPT